MAATVNCKLKTADAGACVVTVIAWSALPTVSAAEPLDESNPASPANEAPTPVGYEPAPMPVRLTPESIATPLEFVWVLPTLVPFNVNATGSLATGVALFVSVAERLVVPPNVPVAGSTASAVTVADEVSLKQT